MRTAALVALLAVGCAHAPHLGDAYHVSIDPAFTSAEQTAVLDALDDWSAHVPVRFEPVVETCAGEHNGVICTHRSTTAEVVHGQRVAFAITFGSSSGDDVDGGEMWFAVDALAPSGLQGVAAHEIGHAMGLQHESGCLMAPTMVGWSPTVTAKDAAQWVRIRGS